MDLRTVDLQHVCVIAPLADPIQHTGVCDGESIVGALLAACPGGASVGSLELRPAVRSWPER